MAIAARRIRSASPPVVGDLTGSDVQIARVGTGANAVTVVFSTGRARRVRIPGGASVTTMTGNRMDVPKDHEVLVDDDPIYVDGTAELALAP